MELGIDSVDDFNIKYKDGCIVTLTSEKHEILKPTLFTINRLDGCGMLKGYIDEGDWTPRSFPLKHVDIDFSFPELGAVNFDRGVHLVIRHAPRQWRRAFTTANEVITYASVDDETRRIMRNKRLGTAIAPMRAIFFPKYYPIMQALDLIAQKKCWSVALNNRYYVGISPRLPYIYLGYNGYIIGRVRKRDGACTIFNTAIPLIEDLSTTVEVC